jgi:hypothetical protein
MNGFKLPPREELGENNTNGLAGWTRQQAGRSVAAPTSSYRTRMLFPSEESKESKWSIIFPVLRFVLIQPPLNLREPLERSFNV